MHAARDRTHYIGQFHTVDNPEKLKEETCTKMNIA
jgi:hypothetical protein